jgi:uncharacterized protein involved in exopolysaccharide biosynthesis
VTRTATYRETFRKHRLLLSLPIVLACFIAMWTALGSQKSYSSAASLWVDSPANTDSSLGNLNPAVMPPAQQEEQVITELLATRVFVRAVAQRSGLTRYLATHTSGGFGPSALLSKLGGAGSMDSRVAAALSPSSVTLAVPGPQVLELSYSGPTATIAQRTLQAMVTQLQQDSALYGQQHSESALAYYKAQVHAASQAVASARDQLNAYLGQHRGASSSDSNLSALQTAQGVANSQLTQANVNLNRAVSASRGGGDTGSAVHVIDAASVPTGPASGKKKQLLAIIGGLFAGLVISFLGAVALTPSKPIRWEDEEPAQLHPVGVGPAASVGETALKNDGMSTSLPVSSFFLARRLVPSTPPETEDGST